MTKYTITDNWTPKLSVDDRKCLSVILKKINLTHKPTATLSLQSIKRLTGLKNTHIVSDSLKTLSIGGLIAYIPYSEAKHKQLFKFMYVGGQL